MASYVIGIDLGTTSSCVAVYKNQKVVVIPNEHGSRTTPSVVCFMDSEIFVGQEALDMRAITPTNVIYGCKITEAVITVPAYFNNCQKQATKNAGEIAGLKVLKVLTEPTSAVIQYVHDNKGTVNGLVLVFDLGKGTFDVSIVRIDNSNIEVLSTSGDTHLGGNDFDSVILEYSIAEIVKRYSIDVSGDSRAKAKLKVECEKAKRTLSVAQDANIIVPNIINGIDIQIKITKAKFNSLCSGLFTRINKPIDQALEEAKLTKYNIDKVLLVGGSTRVPKVKEQLSKYFIANKIAQSIHPEEAVAAGAAIYASQMSSSQLQHSEKIYLEDVVPLPLGVKISEERMHCIIDKNTKFPTRKTRKYRTSEDNQLAVEICVYEGESDIVGKNNKLGMFTLSGLQPKPKGEIEIEALEEAKLTKDNIDKVLLVGGSIRVPKVKEQLSKYFTEDKIVQSINPDEAVAAGAAIHASQMSSSQLQHSEKIYLEDVVPLPLGIKISEERMHCIIDKNTKFPTSKTQKYRTSEDNQLAVEIWVYEGESDMVIENDKLGMFTLSGLQPKPKGEIEIEVIFALNDDGILEVTAVEVAENLRKTITIEKDASKMTQEELAKISAEFKNDCKGTEEFKKAQELKNIYENIVREIGDEIDEEIEAKSDKYNLSSEFMPNAKTEIKTYIDWANGKHTVLSDTEVKSKVNIVKNAIVKIVKDPKTFEELFRDMTL
uniref:Heat shock protein 70 n=1 Tax=Rhabditophanes sp. KR3021 TaxID=114890 RepID=A0AC35TVM5_9BILA